MPDPYRKKPVAKGSRAGFLSVGQTARILGISSSTLRLWENVGLISPARSTGHYRLYDPEMLGVLKRIKYLRDVKKLNVPGIKDALGNGGVHRNSHPPEPKLEIGESYVSYGSVSIWGSSKRRVGPAFHLASLAPSNCARHIRLSRLCNDSLQPITQRFWSSSTCRSSRGGSYGMMSASA